MKNYRVISVLTASLIVWSAGATGTQPGAASSGGDVAVSAAAKKLDPAVVQAKMRNLERQAALINQLADKFQPEAAALFGAGFNVLDWKRDFGARLMYQSLESLSKALNAPNLSTAQNTLAPSSSVAKHTTDDNWVINYLATPCRIVDTRFGGGGVLGPTPRSWRASASAATIAAQGGNAAGCGSFPDAQGWVLYVTVVPAVAGPNFLTVQHDSGVPTTATMTYYSQVLSNFAVTSDFNNGFYAYASGNTHVVIDLLAWTGTRAIGPAALDCTNVAMTGTTGAVTGLRTVSAVCAAGYTVAGGGCDTSDSGAGPITSSRFSAFNGWLCESNNYPGNATAFSISGSTRCCRVPAGL